jgi:hypothetical protein
MPLPAAAAGGIAGFGTLAAPLPPVIDVPQFGQNAPCTCEPQFAQNAIIFP